MVMMRTAVATLLAAFLVTAAAPVSARQLDLSTVKCKEFMESGKDTMALIMMWMHGYYADQEAAPVIDFDKMTEDTAKLAEYCTKNPDNGLITAAEEVLQ